MNRPPSWWEMWFVFLLEDVFLRFSVKTSTRFQFVCDDSRLTTFVSRVAVVCIFKRCIKTWLTPFRDACWERVSRNGGARSKKYRVKRRRSKTEAANSFHTTAGGNLTEVNICQSSIYLNSMTSEGSLVRQLIFVEISGAIMFQKLTYVLLWWRMIGEEVEEGMKKERKNLFSQSGNHITEKQENMCDSFKGYMKLGEIFQ